MFQTPQNNTRRTFYLQYFTVYDKVLFFHGVPFWIMKRMKQIPLFHPIGLWWCYPRLPTRGSVELLLHLCQLRVQLIRAALLVLSSGQRGMGPKWI